MVTFNFLHSNTNVNSSCGRYLKLKLHFTSRYQYSLTRKSIHRQQLAAIIAYVGLSAKKLQPPVHMQYLNHT